MVETIIHLIKQTVMITFFVMVMMLLIEYINVQSKGNWAKTIKNNKLMQLFVAALLGIIPGCLGTYTVVSLFTHNIFNFGALVTAMIATSGDEAFVMIAMIPETALKITGIIFVVAIISGIIVNFFVKNRKLGNHNFHFDIHKEETTCNCYEKNFIKNLKNISFQRAILISGLVLFLFGLATGQLGNHNHGGEADKTEIIVENNSEHNHDSHSFHPADTHNHSSELSSDDAKPEHSINWIKLTFLIVSLIALFVAVTVPDHFLEHHLWGHVIKKHFLKIFIWTFIAMLFVNIMMGYVDLEQWVQTNKYYILIIAVLIGIIPESGPHLIFVTMFINGSLPFSILLANSIVQDGHGSLPLLAESKKSFILMKIINIIVGFIVGGVGLYFWS